MPPSQQFTQIVLYHTVDAIDLAAFETAAAMDSDRFKPKLCHVVIALDMDMRWFGAVNRVDKEAIRSNAQDCRHNS
jgi:hypothetical protein